MFNKYWFKPKKYGYGAYPISWEGWLLVLGFIVIAIWRAQYAEKNLLLFTLEMIVIVCVLILVSKKKTEGEWKWHWGG